LPKNHCQSKADQEHEYAPESRQAKKQHSAVESAINALEVHGLDKCLIMVLKALGVMLR